MKRFFLMIVPALICGVIVFISSCNKEDEVGNSALSIYAVGQSEIRSAALDESEKENKSLWCTGDNIRWYNGTTGELKFNTTPPPISGFPPFFYEYLVVFLDDKELIRFETVTPISSISTARPCITLEEDGFYINKGYPRWDPKDRDESTAHWDWESIDAAREENWKAIEPEWDIFIEQLKKEGKYRE